MEINPATLCIEADEVLAAITSATRAVVPVLYGGRAVDLSGIRDVLDAREITVVEDAAHAFGSFCGDTFVGAQPGVLTCFSFGPIKNLTCGQGAASSRGLLWRPTTCEGCARWGSPSPSSSAVRPPRMPSRGTACAPLCPP